MSASSVVYGIEGMHCGHCVSRVQKALEGLAGVARAEIGLEPPRARLELTDPAPGFAALAAAVEGVGYHLVKV